jgi:hypothetical protein
VCVFYKIIIKKFLPIIKNIIIIIIFIIIIIINNNKNNQNKNIPINDDVSRMLKYQSRK